MADCFFSCLLKKEAELSSSPAFTKRMCLMKGVVGNADFSQMMLAENSPSLAAAAKAGGVPGENYSLSTCFTRNLKDPDSTFLFFFFFFQW